MLLSTTEKIHLKTEKLAIKRKYCTESIDNKLVWNLNKPVWSGYMLYQKCHLQSWIWVKFEWNYQTKKQNSQNLSYLENGIFTRARRTWRGPCPWSPRWHQNLSLRVRRHSQPCIRPRPEQWVNTIRPSSWSSASSSSSSCKPSQSLMICVACRLPVVSEVGKCIKALGKKNISRFRF